MALLKRHIRHHSLEEAEKRNDIGFGTLVTDVPTGSLTGTVVLM